MYPKGNAKRKAASDAVKITKGDFTFPLRTYKPKVQIAFHVPPGQISQAVMAERLHRIYKKTDINLVLQTLGIELSDLIPLPTYGESNERFYQEMMFRNRTKINGFDKKEVLARGGKFKQYGLDDEEEEGETTLHKADVDSSLSGSSSDSGDSGSKSDESEAKSLMGSPDEDEDVEGNEKTGIHPFIQSKPPFGPQLPLSFFDNTEYDIRSGEDWCTLGWEEKEQRFYPLPAKAFLPLPLPAEKRAKMKAPSEVTVEEILRKTPRLEKFRSWLLRERFQRQMRLAGIDPSKAPKGTPSEMEMALVARLGSTVETQATLSNDSVLEIHKPKKKDGKGRLIGDAVTSLTLASSPSLEQEEDQSNSNSDPQARKNESNKDEDQLNIVFKLRLPKKDDELSDDDDRGLTINDDAKRSVSIMSDVFSDLDSLTMMGSDIITQVQNVLGPNVEVTDAEEIDEDTEETSGSAKASKRLTRPVRSYFMGDYGINLPLSPDFDPFEDGLDQYVIDFDKMRKVHIYDWRWVDVAVFDYHPGDNKYFVRSVMPPVVYAWVSKVYLCFDAEDPNKHGLRIKDAVKRRIDMENIMRYNLYIDCLPMLDFPEVSGDVMVNIVERTGSLNLKTTEHALAKVTKEINLEYQRQIAEEKFERLVEKHQKTFHPWVEIPDKTQSPSITHLEKISLPITQGEFSIPVELQNFDYKKTCLQKATVIYTEEAWKPYHEITNICMTAKNKPIILTDLLPVQMDDWEKAQEENIEEMTRYLEEEWYELVVTNLRENFGKTNKSWYNLDEPDYDIFLISKLSNFLQLVKLIMQDTIRSIVKDSANRCLEQVKMFSTNIDPGTDWTWGGDLLVSEYPPPFGVLPIWVIEMYLDPREGPRYTQPLPTFYKMVYGVFVKAIESCSKMPALLTKVMPHMQFGALGNLRGVDRNELEMVELAHQLVKYTKLILLPLDSYIRKFAKFKEVWMLDIPSFIKKLEASDPSANDIRRLVEQHRRHMERLEKEIPNVIRITAFHVVIDPVREGILKRKKNLINAILDSYASKLRKIVQKVQKDYQEMEKKLTTRSNDIEEVMELKGYVEIVPSLVARLGAITSAVIKDYEVFDHFMYQASNEDVNQKWQAALNSNRILRLGREAIKWLDDDFDRLLKVQQGDLSALSDQVDSATLTVAGLAAFTELEKAKDVCEKIKNIWKTIKELQEQSELLNRRQKIFNLPMAQTEALNRLTRDIEPFKNLWFTASDWLTIQETLYGGTLDKIDIEHVTKVITEGGKVIKRCIKYFAGADQIQQIAKSIKHDLEMFKPLMPLIRTLKKHELRQRHWQAISEVCGFTVVERANQHFKTLLDQGIQNHVKEIVKIGDLATKEYEEALKRQE